MTAEGDQERRGRTRRRDFALVALCTLLFLTFLDNTIVSVALGDVQQSLHAGVQQLQWIVNAYALVFAAMMLTAGVLGDLIGHRKVMLAGAGVFCVGSVVCAVAPTPTVLIAGRAVMGLGAAASEPGTLAMLRHVYPSREARARATGVWAAVSGLALALGPVIGGTILGFGGGTLFGLASWRYIFWFNLLLGAAAVAVGLAVLPETPAARRRRLDLLGTVLGAGSLALLVFAIINGETDGYTSPSVLTLFVVGGVAAVAFGWWQNRAADPLIDLRGVRRPVFATSNLVAFAAYFGTFAIFFFCALYLRVVVGDSGYVIAALFLPMMVAMIISALATGRWIARASLRSPLVAGCLVFAVGLVLTGRTLNPHPASLPLVTALTLAGLGIGATLVPTTFGATNSVPAERAGMASSAVNTSREIGAVAGTAILGAIVNASLTSNLADQLHRLGIPSAFQGIVIGAVEHGQAPPAGSGGTAAASAAFGPIVQQVLDAAYGAFYSGLHASLLLSAAALVVAGLTAAVGMRHAVAPEARIATAGSQG